MPFLQLGALTVKATEFRRLPDEIGGGGLRRTVNGDLRGRSDWTRKAWAGAVYAANAAELADILAAANPDTPISATGDAFTAAVTVRVQVSGDIPYVRERDVWYHFVPLTLREA